MATFKRVSTKLSSTGVVAYTAPAAGAIVIGVLAANTGNDTTTANLNVIIRRSSVDYYMLGKNTPVYYRSALSIDAGKVVLESGDQLVVSASAEDSSITSSLVDLHISLMEND